MVNISDRWEVQEGSRAEYELESEDGLTLSVEPSIIQDRGSVSSMSVGVPAEKANAYTVMQFGGMSQDDIISFERTEDAIEFVQLVTLYLDEQAGAVSMGEIISSDPMSADAWQPSGVVTDKTPEEAIRKMLGHYSFMLDEVLADQP